MFPSDEKFGRWVRDHQLDGHDDMSRLAAMWVRSSQLVTNGPSSGFNPTWIKRSLEWVALSQLVTHGPSSTPWVQHCRTLNLIEDFGAWKVAWQLAGPDHLIQVG